MKTNRPASSLLLAVIDAPGPGSLAHAQPWTGLLLLLVGIALVGRCVLRGHAARDMRSLWAGITLLIAAVAVWFWSVPSSRLMNARDPAARGDTAPLSPDALAARQVIERRCSACHSSHPTLMHSAPWRLNFDRPGAIARLAPAIYRQAVVLRNMPVGNITHMTAAERDIIARWYQQRMHPPAARHHNSAER